MIGSTQGLDSTFRQDRKLRRYFWHAAFQAVQNPSSIDVHLKTN